MEHTKHNLFFLFTTIIISLLFAPISSLYCQDEPKVSEKMKHFKDEYIETFESDFNTVWSAVKLFVDERGCRLLSERERENDFGLQKGICQSEICVITQNTDSAFKMLQHYGLRPPFIRGGVWTAARVQYRFVVDDIGDGKVTVQSRLELNGWENHASFKAHEVTSNGLLEFEAFERIKEIINTR